MAKNKLVRVYNIDVAERIARPADLVVFGGDQQRAGLILQTKVMADGRATEGFLYFVVSVISRDGLSQLSVEPLREAILNHSGPVYLGHLAKKRVSNACTEDMWDHVFGSSYGRHTRTYGLTRKPHRFANVPVVGRFLKPTYIDHRPDFSTSFVLVAYTHAGMIESSNLNLGGPVSLLELKLFSNELYLLKGFEDEDGILDHYNTVEVPQPHFELRDPRTLTTGGDQQ